MAIYSQHGGLPGEGAGKQGSFFCDLCKLAERDKLETPAILYWNGGVFLFMRHVRWRRGKYSLSVYSGAILGKRVLLLLHQARLSPVSDLSDTCYSG